MAAVAHSFDEESHADPAEAEMSEAAFAVIQRAHELCGHPAAVELTAEPDLIAHATKILGAMIFAGKLVREMRQRGEFEDVGVICPVDGDDATDEVELTHLCQLTPASAGTEPPVDWKEVAEAAWRDEGWALAATEYAALRGRARIDGMRR
jgi:hypothetical protein